MSLRSTITSIYSRGPEENIDVVYTVMYAGIYLANLGVQDL
jgi:hypothetical protein